MDEKEIGYINTLPLVDVMLVLLTIALTTVTFIKEGALAVDLPNAKAQTIEVPKVFTVTITNDRIWYVNGIEVNEDNINLKLELLNREDLCEIYTDKTVMVEDLTLMMSRLNTLGFSKVVIKTKNINN